MSRSSQRAFHAQNRIPTRNKRQRFVEEYVIDCNATQAALRAGYSAKTSYAQGSRLLKDAEISAAIKAKLEEKNERAELTADEVINGIRETIRRCEGQGREFQPFAVLKGYELLGKHKKLFTDKLEVSGDEELFERLAAGRKRLQS